MLWYFNFFHYFGKGKYTLKCALEWRFYGVLKLYNLLFLLFRCIYLFIYFYCFRQIFERVIHINLSSKKMKLFFKRYLDFERKYGDALSIENVKTKTVEYVESKAALI